MKHLALILPCLAVLTANAQIDINKMMQEKMAKQGQGSGQPGGAGVKLEDDNDPFVPNEFTGSFRMEMHHYDGELERKNSPTNMYYWSTPDMTLMRNDAAEQPGQEMKILTDLKEKWTYTLMTDKNGKRTAMKSRKQKVTTTVDGSDAKKQPVITVTKETKVIEGYTCTKVTAVSETGTWTGWVSDEVKSPFLDMARNVGSGKKNGAQMETAKLVAGTALEFEWVDADGKGRTTAFVRELVVGKLDASTFSLDGYEVMEMPVYGR